MSRPPRNAALALEQVAELVVAAESAKQDVPTDADAERSCRELARELVGKLGVREAQELLRGAMYSEALMLSGGSRRAAARILGVDRRCVQRIVAEAAVDARPRAEAGVAHVLRAGHGVPK